MEKVIRGLEHCIEKLDTVTNKAHGFNCTICPYFADCDSTGYLVGLPLMRDALALLKKQEPVVHGEWKWSHGGECSECGFHNSNFDYRYCPYCGAKMDG